MKSKSIFVNEKGNNIMFIFFLRIKVEVLIHATAVGNNKSQCVGRKTWAQGQ